MASSAPTGYSVGSVAAMLNLTTTASASSAKESQTDSFRKPQYSAMSSHSSIKGTPADIAEWLMSCQADSPASHFQSPESETPTTAATCGQQPSPSFVQYNPDSHSWRMSQAFFPSMMDDTSDAFSETWPRAGTMRDGECYRQPNWELLIKELDSGLWRTPRANESGDYQYSRGNKTKPTPTLAGQVKSAQTWPTPASRDWKDTPGMAYTGVNPDGSIRDRTDQLARKVYVRDGGTQTPQTGQLNPSWVEWLMGWPIGWTDLKPLETGKFRLWLRLHGIY